MKKTISIAASIICMAMNFHAVSQNLNVKGSDISLGTNDGRPIGSKPYQRALVHFTDDKLILNYEGDFEGGTFVNSDLTVTGFVLNHNGADFRLGLSDGRAIGSKPLQRALVHGNNDQLILNYGYDFEGGTIVNSDLTVTGFSLNHNGADFRLGLSDGRAIGSKPAQRALVHGNNDQLIINYDGDFEGGVFVNGKVGIGTASPRNELDVNGTIRAREIKVEASPWPDYVFDNSYKLKSLNEVEAFINTNKHLPDVPSALQIKEQGVNLGEINAKLLQKIEELTLYTIEQHRQLEKNTQELSSLKEENETLKLIANKVLAIEEQLNSAQQK